MQTDGGANERLETEHGLERRRITVGANLATRSPRGVCALPGRYGNAR